MRVEKAHPDIFNSLLQILEDGRLTDSQRARRGFQEHRHHRMTTNLGTRDISKSVGLGFGNADDEKTSYERMKSKVNEELKNHFRPEFLNRIDDIIVFHQLTESEIVEIVDLMLAKLDERLRDKDMGIELTPAAKAALAARGYDPVLGARPLRRTIQRDIEDALSEKILFGDLKPGEIVVVDAEGHWRGCGVHLHRCGEASDAGDDRCRRRGRWRPPIAPTPPAPSRPSLTPRVSKTPSYGAVEAKVPPYRPI